jgi:radical SAM superfamily enzyme YgiQ (UPF0313 family)
MSGVALKESIKFAKFVRLNNPKLKIIWGGVHVSFFPTQSIKSKYIDVIIKSEGEETLKEILDRLKSNKSIHNIKGTITKKGKEVIVNPDRTFMDLDKLDLPAYDLIDLDKYADSVEYLSYESSRGCPHRCKFCYGLNFHKKRWRAKSAGKVAKDLALITRLYKPKKIDFVEDNFFVDRKRVEAIAKAMIKNKLNFKWMAFCRADYLSGFDDVFLRLLNRSGCELLSIGVESGSPTMLKKITKDITPDQVLKSAKACIRNHIMPVMSFIIGIPGETKREMYETLDFYDKLFRLSKKLEVNGIFVYGPYPGTPIYEKAVQLGYKPYETLEGWSNWKYTDIDNTPWLPRSYKKKLEVISIISRFKFFTHRIELYSNKFKKAKLKTNLNLILYTFFVPILKLDANIRWSLRFFSMSPEWKLYQDMIERKFDKR